MSMMGSTISLAGKPRRKAARMTPSRPMRRPRGSRRPVKAARRLGESGPAGTSQPPEGPAKERLARSQMTSPAGAESEETPMEDRSTMTVFDEEGVKVVFRMKKGSDEAETIIKAVISNANEADVEEFAMQAAVPKYMKVQMKPISDPIIPGRNEDVSTQLIRVRNNAYGEVGREKGE